MKKIILAITVLFVSYTLYGQERGSFITLSGGVGPSGLRYTLEENNSVANGYSQRKIGGQGQLGYSYFFTKKVGIATGFGISQYRTTGGYDQSFSKDNFFLLDNIQYDDDKGEYYYLRVRFENWKEIQKITNIEIPLMAMFQHKFGRYQRHGIYLGVGVKFLIPIKSTYSVEDGKRDGDYRLNVSGYYPNLSGDGSETILDVGSPDAPAAPAHGFGSISNPNKALGWEGKMNVKFNVAGSIEGGFLLGLSGRVDLSFGAYLDYGFMDIQKERNNLLEFSEQYQPNANRKIGNGIAYSGLVNSTQIERVNTISYGGKIGLRVKLGKLEVPTREADEDRERLRQEEDSLFRAGQGDFNDAMLKAVRDLQKGLNELLTWKDMVDNRLDEIGTVSKAPEYPYGMTKEEYETVAEKRTYFTLNSSALRSSQHDLLDRKIEIMKKYPELRIQVSGNTCDLGSAVLNGNLGLFRAKAVRDYMISKGISESRIVITTQSYNNPLLPNTNEENRSQNRRCDFEIMPAK
jgi:outer membrane protein OmpA-like peptidoglycan-associated protein